MSDDQRKHQSKIANLPPYRIGHGYDVHRFGEGNFIVLGGVKIPHHSGFVAHSDGDVLIHALCDALLGAIAAGDIGQHFPDTDEQYKDIESSVLLNQTRLLLMQQHYDIINVDVTIIAQSPQMSPHIPMMLKNLSTVLKIESSQLNIKATTTERLGFTGREEGIAVHSVVMLYKNMP
jgi:2-C-methyl-D-erythritol 2,4-cyclodiphosphate synthase